MHIYLPAVGLLLCLIDFPLRGYRAWAYSCAAGVSGVGGRWQCISVSSPNWVNLVDQFRENMYTLSSKVFRSNLGAPFVNIVDEVSVLT